MHLTELTAALRKLRLSGMAGTLEIRALEAQSRELAPIDFISTLVADELQRRSDRLIERRTKLAQFRDPDKTIESFDFDFAKPLNRATVFELAVGHFISRREDVLFLGPPGTGKSHIAQAIGRAAILQGHRILYREAHALIEELTEATIDGTRKSRLQELAAVPLLIIDDLGMRKLPHSAAEDLLELIMGRYERASTLITSNRPIDDWGKLLGDTAAVTAMLDRLLHHGHVVKFGPKSWRTRKAGLKPEASQATT
jgi:DNA replication protein DnaC